MLYHAGVEALMSFKFEMGRLELCEQALLLSFFRTHGSLEVVLLSENSAKGLVCHMDV